MKDYESSYTADGIGVLIHEKRQSGAWHYDHATKSWRPLVREYRGPSGNVYVTEPGGVPVFEASGDGSTPDFLREALTHVPGREK